MKIELKNQIITISAMIILLIANIYFILELEEKETDVNMLKEMYLEIRDKKMNLEKTRYILVNNFCFEKSYDGGYVERFDYFTETNMSVYCVNIRNGKFIGMDNFILPLEVTNGSP